jgi:hypothetical protein
MQKVGDDWLVDDLVTSPPPLTAVSGCELLVTECRADRR